MYPWVQKGAASTKSGKKKFSNLKLDQVKRILVIRHAALGDMIQTRPFLYELKKLFPQSEVVLSLASHYQYAAPTDLVDSVHIMYGQDMRGKPLLEKYKNIKEVGEFDLLIDLAATTRSELLSFLTKAKVKLGFPYRPRTWLYDISMFRSDLNFEAQILLEFLSLFGHKPEYPLNFNLPVHSKTHAKKTFSYFMGSSSLERNYPVDKFLNVISELAKMYPDHEQGILQGVKPDEKFLKEHQSLAHLPNVKLIPSMSLENLTKYLSEVRILVSNDTGVRHIALGTHTPTIGLFGTSIPYRNWPRYEDLHDCVLAKYDEHPSAQEVISAAQ